MAIKKSNNLYKFLFVDNLPSIKLVSHMLWLEVGILVSVLCTLQGCQYLENHDSLDSLRPYIHESQLYDKRYYTKKINKDLISYTKKQMSCTCETCLPLQDQFQQAVSSKNKEKAQEASLKLMTCSCKECRELTLRRKLVMHNHRIQPLKTKH